MNHSYLRGIRWTSRRLRQSLLLLALVLPGLSYGQNFTETFGTATSFQFPADADAAGEFDKSALLVFGGNAVVSPDNAASNLYTFTNEAGQQQGASGDASIVFGRENPNQVGTVQVQQGQEYTLSIGGINTTGLSSRQRISFGLRAPAAGVDGDLVLEARDGNDAGSAFVSIPFTFSVPSTGFRWTLVSTAASLPSTTNLILQFRKLSGNNRQYRVDDVTLRAFQPSLTVSIGNQLFPNTAVNQQSISRTLTVTGTDLLGNATVTAPVGFLVRLAGSNNAYAQSATVTPNANGNASAQFDVVFAPTFSSAPGPYPQNLGGDIVVSSTGATNATIGVSGNATAPQPRLTASETSLAFGTQPVGTSSTPQSFLLTGQDLAGNVTVSAPAGYEIRTNSTSFSPNPLVLVPNAGALSETIFVRFVPGTTGSITGNVVAVGSGSATVSVAVSGSGTPAPTTPTINATPLTLNFQTVTNSGSAQTQTFTASATNLSGPLTLTASNANIQFRNLTAGGGSFVSTLDIQPNASGNITNQTIEVTLVPTVGSGNFSGNILLASGSATATVSISANNPSGAISDISVTDAILREFSTSPAVPSDIQSYKVSADNLLQDLTIQAPQFFQISLSADPAAAGGFNSLGTTTGNSLVLPRIQGSSTASQNGDVNLTTIYIRYFPPAAQTNRGQVISNSSAPARTQFVSVNGSSEPEVNVRGSFIPVVNQVKGTKSATQTLVIVGARLNSDVVVRVPQDPEPPTTASPLNPARTPQFQISLQPDFSDIGSVDNPTGFQLTLKPDANDSLPRVRLYTRYAPTRVILALADLLFRTPDLNSNVEFTIRPNARLQGSAIDVEPTRQSSATVVRSNDGTSVTITFTQENGSTFPGNPEAAGFGENRLIIASTSNTLGVESFPQDGVSYNPNSAYGAANASTINGNYVVFGSSATSVVITNLNPLVQYFFFGFEYNNDQTGGAENYKTPNLPVTVQFPLPVELVSFTAQLRSGQVNLNWVTASEKNNRGFEVQRSQNGRDFSTLLFKAGRGTTSARTAYETVDARPLPGLSYYRLKQIDVDGTFSYSPVVAVKNASLTEATFYPNPTSGKLTIALPQAQTADALQVRVTDLMGRVLREQALPVSGEVDLTALPAGTYLVTVGAGDQQVTRKVVKN